MESMFYKTDELKSFIAVINKTERIEDQYITQLSLVKLSRTSSKKIYIRQLYPKEGIEILLNTSKSKKAIINLNSFPWINLYLDPNGYLMRKNQHHVVQDSGFDLMASILQFELASNNPNQKLLRKPDTYWNGHKLYHLELANRDYKIVDYVVGKDEDLDNIADKLKINTYSIIELNDDVDSHTDVKVGQKIKVPNHYAKSMTLYIDQTSKLPLVIKVFDHNGLYEKYEYNSITINPTFTVNEFTEEFEHYNF